MYHAISDSSLNLTVATHSYKGRWGASHLSLYKRNKRLDIRSIIPKSSGKNSSNSSWGIVDVVNLGRSQFDVSGEFEKDQREGDGVDMEMDMDESQGQGGEKMENCMVLAIICARNSFGSVGEGEEQDGVQLLGDSDDDDMSDEDDDGSTNTSSDGSDSDSDAASTDSEDRINNTNHNGEIVIVIASRRKITIQKRIPLHTVPDFIPTVAMHPLTYLNKILIGGSNGDMILANIRSGRVIHSFKCLGSGGAESKITVLEQSPAVDTVAIGTASGMVHLVNIRMDVKLFSLTHTDSRSSKRNQRNQAITSLSFRTDAMALEHEIAPLAVGQMNGTISIWDLTPRSNDDSDDEFSTSTEKNTRRTLLCQMEHAHRGGVSHLAYLPQEPLLLSSGVKSNSLVMHIFDNPNHTGRVLRQRAGHVAPPCVVRYQHSSNGGVLASMADGTDAASCQILSCGGKGDNALRVFSTARSVLDREYGQGRGLVKKARELGLEGGKADLLLKPITGMSHCESKSRDWGDLVTIHKDHAMAYVWSTKQKSQSGPVLRQEEWNVSAMKVQPPKSAHATAVAMSSCGNFAVVGTKGGAIYKYNIQSGMPRGSFPRDATDSKGKTKKNAKVAGNINRTTKMLERTLKIHKLHNEEEKDISVLNAEARRRSRLQLARHIDSSVTGLAVDTLNKTLVSVGSDAKLILWSFTTHAPHRKSPVSLSAPATKLVHARDSDLLAIALEDYSVVLFDCSSFSVVRRFSTVGSTCQHTGPISDVAFGPDGRNLYTSSFDGTLRVWDVPTNTCVDWMTFSSAPTALSLSTTGEFLVTAHQGKLGISLWCDRSFFQTVHLDGAHPPSKPFQMDEPAAAVEEEDEDALVSRALNDKTSALLSSLAFSNEKADNEGSTDDEKLVIPKKDGLITLSGLPAAHWRNLFHLELVKERNKPSEAPKKSPSAPFFLQWRGGDNGDNTNTPEIGADNEPGEKSKKADDEEWDAAWSDDNGDDEANGSEQLSEEQGAGKRKTQETMQANKVSDIPKKQKITHFRSELAALLERCSATMNFEAVTEHLAAMGPSAIDVEFSSLCHGMHDLDIGLKLLHLCSMWLLESCKSRKNYEVINAYMHRFLHIHATTIAGIDASTQGDTSKLQDQGQDESKDDAIVRTELLETIKELRISHRSATGNLRNKMQETLCLLRHFSRMV
jgi:U3 small nucleolar RNA-associated protein 21